MELGDFTHEREFNCGKRETEKKEWLCNVAGGFIVADFAVYWRLYGVWAVIRCNTRICGY